MSRVIAAILLVIVLVVGGGIIATTAYNAGITAGTTVTTTTTADGTAVAPVVVAPYAYGWHGFGWGGVGDLRVLLLPVLPVHRVRPAAGDLLGRSRPLGPGLGSRLRTRRLVRRHGPERTRPWRLGVARP